MDIKLKTFLTVCETMNYREASEQLHITQPAVTKHIQALEQIYDVKLFHYDKRKLEKTSACYILERSARAIQYSYDELRDRLKQPEKRLLRVGATKTIGNYVIGDAVSKYLKERPENQLSLVVDNTEHLLTMLDHNQLDFALIEGVLDKSVYYCKLYREEPFVGICAKTHPFCNREVTVQELLKETVLLREEGSGTRDILKRELEENGYGIHDFAREVTISSFLLMKELIQKDAGISMVYEAVARNDRNIGTFKVKNFSFFHEFNVVCLKGTVAENYAKEFLLS